MAVRTGQPVAEGEAPSLFQAAMEGRHGPSPGLTAIRTADGQILCEPDAVPLLIGQSLLTLVLLSHLI